MQLKEIKRNYKYITETKMLICSALNTAFHKQRATNLIKLMKYLDM